MIARRLRTYLAVIILILALGPSLPALSFAAGDAKPKEDPKNALKRFKINIGKLRNEIDSHLAKIKESGQKEENLLDELGRIDEKFAQQKRKLFALQERLAAQEELLVVKEDELKQARTNKENMRKHLENRLRAFYTMGRTGFLNVTFSTKNLPELLLFNDSFMRLLAYDQSVISMYRETIGQLERAKATHVLEKTLLQDFIKQNDEEKRKLAEVRQEKQELLEKIKTEKGLYEQALKEMQKAEQNLTATLTDLKRKQVVEKKGFLLSKGKLFPPVHGQLVRRFGEKPENEKDTAERQINGITIKTRENAPVRAIFPGSIIFSGYMRGYGNTVIIDHGVRHYTISARLDSLTRKEKDKVESGDVVGTTGDIATLFDNGFYFEIRNNATPLDPLEWFDEKLLQQGD